jgi:acetyl-CoA carboxylase alpha subunit
LGRALRKQLSALKGMSGEDLVEDRYRKFRALGVFTEA